MIDLGILKKIASQRRDVYFESDKEVSLLHSRLLGEYTDE